MAFSLYCLIDKSSKDLSLELLAEQLRECFSKTDGFSLEYEEDPFDSSEKHLLLSWGEWWTRVFYETGQHVVDDSREIANYVDSDRADEVSTINRRIVVRFADDDSRSYTNHAILMMDYLEDMPNIIIFNPQKNTFVKE